MQDVNTKKFLRKLGTKPIRPQIASYSVRSVSRPGRGSLGNERMRSEVQSSRHTGWALSTPAGAWRVPRRLRLRRRRPSGSAELVLLPGRCACALQPVTVIRDTVLSAELEPEDHGRGMPALT